MLHKPVYFSKLRACKSCSSMHGLFWKCAKCRSFVCNKCLRFVEGQALCRACAGSSIDPLHLRAAVLLFVLALSLLFLALA